MSAFQASADAHVCKASCAYSYKVQVIKLVFNLQNFAYYIINCGAL